MNMRRIIVASAIVLVSGCASRPVSTNEAVTVPPDKIVDSRFSHKLPNSGEVIVKRDSGFVGGACRLRIFIDAVAIAEIDTSEKVVSYLPEGEHIISAQLNSPCAATLVEVNANVKAGGRSTYRFGTGTNFDFGLFPTAF
jgi:type IV pilus biogenesis protein CpaD/CtpE